MRKVVLRLAFSGILLIVPLATSAATRALWQLKTVEDLVPWQRTDIRNMELTGDGLRFAIEGMGDIYRPLPEDFPNRVDGIVIKMYVSSLTGAEVVLIEAKGERLESIVRSTAIPLSVSQDQWAYYTVSLSPYRESIGNANVFSLRMKGDAQDVVVTEIAFVDQPLGTKIINAIRSFFWLQPLAGHSVNILTGPVILTDFDRFHQINHNQFALSASINVHLLVGLSLFGCGVLFWGLLLAAKRKIGWGVLRRRMDIAIFSAIAVVWLGYDARMSTEVLASLLRDHQTYVFASPKTRQLRDAGSIHEFAAFFRPVLKNRSSYELLIDQELPDVGILQYETYPSLPNLGEQNSDIWVIYGRSDVSVGGDHRLYIGNMPVSTSGIILGRYSSDSFVFRELNSPFYSSASSS